MKKSLVSVVTLLLVFVMTFAGFVPVISHAAESKSAKDQIAEVIPDRIKDTNWVDVTLNGDEFILTLNPDLDALDGISKEQLKSVIDKVLFYSKNAVKDSLKNNKQFYRDLWAIAHEVYADYAAHGSISETLLDPNLPRELIGYVKAVLLAAHAADIIDANELKSFAVSAKDSFVEYAKVLYNKAYGYADAFITGKVNSVLDAITDADFENIADMIDTAWAMYDKVIALTEKYNIELSADLILTMLDDPTAAMKKILEENGDILDYVDEDELDEIIEKLANNGSLIDTIFGAITEAQKNDIIDKFKEKLKTDEDFRNDILDAFEDELIADYEKKFTNIKDTLEAKVKAAVFAEISTMVSQNASNAVNGDAKDEILSAVIGAIDDIDIPTSGAVTLARACEIINDTINGLKLDGLNLNAIANNAIKDAIEDVLTPEEINKIKANVETKVEEAIEDAIEKETELTIDINLDLSKINVTIPTITDKVFAVAITPAHLSGNSDDLVDAVKALEIQAWLGSDDFKAVVSSQLVDDELVKDVETEVINGVDSQLNGVFATYEKDIKDQVINYVKSEAFLNNLSDDFIDNFIKDYVTNFEDGSKIDGHINDYITDYIKDNYKSYIEDGTIVIDEILENNSDVKQIFEEYVQNEINSILGGISLDTVKGVVNKVLTLLENKLGITQDDLVEIADKVLTSGDPVAAVKSIIKDFISEQGAQGMLGLGLKALSVFEEISIGGNVIYSYDEEGVHINLAGIKGLLLSIPGFGDIKDMEELRFSYPIVIDTKYGTVDFTLTLEIAEDAVDDVKAVAALLDRYFSINVVDGTLVFEMTTPAIFSRALRKAVNSDLIPEALKQKALSAFTATGDDFQNLINKLTFDELLQLLEYIPFDEIFDHEFICQFVDLSQYGTEDVIRKVEQYQRYFESAIRYGLRLANAVLNRVPDRFMDNTVMDLIQYQGSNDKFSYSNGTVRYQGTHNLGMDDIKKVLNKVTDLLGVSDKYVGYVEMAFNALLPEFVENGFTGSVDFSVHFEGINRVDYLDEDGNVIKTGFLPAGAKLEYFASVPGAVAWADEDKAIYTMPDKDVVLTPVFANPTIHMDSVLKNHTYDGKEYKVYVNIDHEELYTYTWYKYGKATGLTTRTIYVKNVADSGEYYCVVEGNGKSWTTDTVTVNINPAKDDSIAKDVILDASKFDYEGNIFDIKNSNKVIALLNTGDLKYTIPTVEHKLGLNSVKVTFTSADGNYVGEKTFEWYEKNIVNLSDLKWYDSYNDYDPVTNPDGNELERIYDSETTHEIKLVVPEKYKTLVNFINAISGNTAKNAGSYVAKISKGDIEYDATTVYVIGTAPTYDWTIAKNIIGVNYLFQWSYDSFIYSGSSFIDSVKISNLLDFVEVTYVTEGDGINVGTYKTTATLTLKDEYKNNYELNSDTAEHTWTITPDTIYVTGINWGENHVFNNENYVLTATPVINDLKHLNGNVTIVLSGLFAARNAGDYTARVEQLVWNDSNYNVVFADGVELSHDWTIAPYVIPEFNKDVIQLLTESGTLYPANGFVYAPGVTYGVKVNEAELPTGVVVKSITGNSANLAGTYYLTVVLVAENGNYIFEETTFTDVEWKINRAVIDDSSISLSGKEVVYDGVLHNVEITIDEAIKSLVNIEYYYDGVLDAENRGKYLIGTYRVTVVITGIDTDNYEEFELRLGPKDLVIKGDKKVNYSAPDNSVQVEVVGGLDPDHILNAGITTNVKPSYEVNGKTAEVLVAYDIYFTRGGEIVNLDGKIVNVKLLIPEQYRDIDSDELYVIYIKDDGTVELMEASRCGDYMCFTTDHFSIYAIVRIEGPSLAWLWIILALLLAGGIAVGIIFMMKARKESALVPDEIPAVEAEATEPAETEEVVVEEEAVEEVPEVVEEETPVVEEEAPISTEPQTAVLVMGEDGKEATAVIGGETVHIRFRSSFMSRLIQSTEKVQDFYGTIKNYILSFKGIKARSSWNYEAFNKGRIQLVKLNVKGKTLVVNLNLDPKEFNVDKYHFIDCSDKPKFAKVPMMMKVRSARALKYTLELIDEMMKQYELTQGEIPTVDYRMPYETTEELAMRGVVKIILPAGVTLSEDMTFVHVNVSELIESGTTVKTTEQVVVSEETEAPVVEIEVVAETPTVEEVTEVKEPVIEVLEDGTVHADAEVADQLISDEEAEAKIEVVTVESTARNGKMGEVNLDVICENFDDGDVVDVEALKAKRLVSPKTGRIKVLARGIMYKKLTVKASKFSIQAVKMITLAGGKVELEQ